jgi:hypothetical protein
MRSRTEEQRDDRNEASTVMISRRIAEGLTVADIGAGDGYYTVRLAERVGKARPACWPRTSTPRRVIGSRSGCCASGSTTSRSASAPPDDPEVARRTASPYLHGPHVPRGRGAYGFLWRLRPGLRKGGQVVRGRCRSSDRPARHPARSKLFLRIPRRSASGSSILLGTPEFAGYYAQFEAIGPRPAATRDHPLWQAGQETGNAPG